MQLMRRITGIAVVLAVATMMAAAPALAIDAPKWQAVLYVDAQKAVGLRWLPVAGATGYKVLRSEKSGADFKEVAAPTANQYFDKDAQPGTQYYYVVQATAGDQVSVNSDEKGILTPGSKAKITLPPVWDKISVQSATEFGKVNYKVGLFWKAVPDVISYQVLRTTTPGKDYQQLASVQETQYIDATVEEGKTYYYTLFATDSSFQDTKYSEEREAKIVAVKKVEKVVKVRLKVEPRRTKALWAKTKGDDTGKFAMWEPSDIDVNERLNRVYVVSNNTKEVYILNADNGALIKSFGGPGADPGLFLYPLGLYIDEQDRVLVVDRMKNAIVYFSAEGAFIKEVVPKPPAEPVLPKKQFFMDVVRDKDGLLYITDSLNARIWVVDESGAFQRFIGEPGNKPENLNNPLYLHWTPEGNLTTNNALNSLITTFTKDGKFVSSWGNTRTGVGAFVGIGGLGFDTDGNILVADSSLSVVQGFLSKDGRYLFHTSDEKGEKPASFYTPKTVALDSKNRLFVAEGLIDRVTAVQFIEKAPAVQENPAIE